MNEKRIALLFAGQGAQAVGMGQDLAAKYPAAAELFSRADEILGYPLSQIATVMHQVRSADGVEPLADSLAGWRRRLTDRGRAMLAAAARLAAYLPVLDGAGAAPADGPLTPGRTRA